MKTCLAYIRRFFIFSMVFFGADYSYSGEYSYNGDDGPGFHFSYEYYDRRADEAHQEIMNHYDQMIKQARDSSDSDTLERLLDEAQSLNCAYENHRVFDPFLRTVRYIYLSSFEDYISAEKKKRNARKYIKRFETYVNEIDQLEKSELLTYNARTGIIGILKLERFWFFNEYSRSMMNEYDSLLIEYLKSPSSLSNEQHDRFIYLRDEEVPKLILSLRDSMKEELLERHQKIHQFDDEQRKIRKRISPYFEISAILMQLESDYDDMCAEYRRRYKNPASKIESSSIQKKL